MSNSDTEPDTRQPHEILLAYARGQPVRVHTVREVRSTPRSYASDDEGELLGHDSSWDWYYPTAHEQIDAAKAAAPYYAAKLSHQTIAGSASEAIASTLAVISEKLPV